MKKWLIIILVALAIFLVGIFIYFRSRRPRVKFGKINWQTGDYEFTISADGKRFDGYKNKSETLVPYKERYGRYIFYAGPEPINMGKECLIAILDEQGQVIKGQAINFKTQSIRPYSGKIFLTSEMLA